MYISTDEVSTTFLFFVTGNDLVGIVSELLAVVERFVTEPVTFRCWFFFLSCRYFFMRALRNILILYHTSLLPSSSLRYLSVQHLEGIQQTKYVIFLELRLLA